MFRKISHIILSCVLAVLLLFGGTPKEFIHLFTAHTDTVHHHACGDELSFENEHHHCSFLSFSLTPFIQTDVYLISFKEIKNFHRFNERIPQFCGKASCPYTALRGPPVFC